MPYFYTFLCAYVCFALWLGTVSAGVVASRTAITVNSESSNHWFCAMLIPVKYITVCRRDVNSDLLCGAAKVYFGSGREKEI